jgi:hypothetical protein
MISHDVTTGLGRLKQLRDDLAELSAMEKKPIRFNMGRWYDDRRICGTTACAVGYCSMQDWARKQGLRLIDGMCGTISPMMVPAYGDKKGFEAVSDFFEINGDDAYFLFNDGDYEEDEDGDTDPEIEDVLPRMDYIIARYEAAR